MGHRRILLAGPRAEGPVYDMSAPGDLETELAVAIRAARRAATAILGLSAGRPLDAWEWDIAPTDLIVREAGGVATDLAGAPLRYNRSVPRFASGLVVAADPVLHRSLVEAFHPCTLDRR